MSPRRMLTSLLSTHRPTQASLCSTINLPSTNTAVCWPLAEAFNKILHANHLLQPTIIPLTLRQCDVSVLCSCPARTVMSSADTTFSERILPQLIQGPNPGLMCRIQSHQIKLPPQTAVTTHPAIGLSFTWSLLSPKYTVGHEDKPKM